MFLRLHSSLKTPEMPFLCDMVKDIYHAVILRRINNNAITSGGEKIPIQSVEKVFPFFFFCYSHCVPFVWISDTAGRLFVKLFNREILHYSNLEQQKYRNNNNAN